MGGRSISTSDERFRLAVELGRLHLALGQLRAASEQALAVVALVDGVPSRQRAAGDLVADVLDAVEGFIRHRLRAA